MTFEKLSGKAVGMGDFLGKKMGLPVIVVFAFLISCNEVGLPGLSPAFNESSQQNPEQRFANEFEESTSSEEEGSDDFVDIPSDPQQYTPVAHFPTPPSALTKDRILAFAADTENHVPVVGLSGAAESWVSHVVVTDAQSAIRFSSSQNPQRSIQLSAGSRGLRLADPLSYAVISDICDENFVTCCPVSSDGSFDCYHYKGAASAGSLAMIPVNFNKQEFGETIVDSPQSNALWFGSPVREVVGASSEESDALFARTSDHVVRIVEDQSTFKVSGRHRNQYQALAADDVQQLSYSGANGLLGVHRGDVLDIYKVSALNEGSAVVSIEAREDESIGQVKTSKKKMGFTFESMAPDKSNYLHFYDAVTGLTNSLHFFWRTPWYNWSHHKTLAFDVDSRGYALVIYQNSRDQVRLRMANSFLSPVASDQFFGGADQIRDLVIYRDNTENDGIYIDGLALVLDQGQHRMGVVRFDHRNGFDIRLDRWLQIEGVTSPYEFVVSDDRKTAYVLDLDSPFISILNLDTEDGIPALLKRISIGQEFFADKDIAISPSTLSYHLSPHTGGYLVVADESLNSSFIVNVEDLEL